MAKREGFLTEIRKKEGVNLGFLEFHKFLEKRIEPLIGRDQSGQVERQLLSLLR